MDEFSKKHESAIAASGKANVISFSVRNVFDSIMGDKSKKILVNPEIVLLERSKQETAYLEHKQKNELDNYCSSLAEREDDIVKRDEMVRQYKSKQEQIKQIKDDEIL